MANIALITVVLAVFYSTATASSAEDNVMGHSLCEYEKTPEDCAKFGECLTEAGYTVNDPCDDVQIRAANIEKLSWPRILICNWEKTGQIKEDGSCDLEMQKDYIENKITFENPEAKTAFIAAADECNQENEDDCTSALFCVTKKSIKICYPNAKLPEEDQPKD